MRPITTLRVSVFVATLATAPFGVVDTETLAIGITPAKAEEFYTRKRVRGRWISGHFTRRHSAKSRRGVEPEARPVADRRFETEPVPTTPASKAEPATERAIKPEPVFPAATAQVGRPAASAEPAAPLTKDERLRELQEALHAHARSLVANAESASAAPSVNGSLSRHQLSAASSEPKSVSFEFESGVKTTVFTDGTKVEEPFDPASMKGLASARPVRSAGSSHNRQYNDQTVANISGIRIIRHVEAAKPMHARVQDGCPDEYSSAIWRDVAEAAADCLTVAP